MTEFNDNMYLCMFRQVNEGRKADVDSQIGRDMKHDRYRHGTQ